MRNADDLTPASGRPGGSALQRRLQRSMVDRPLVLVVDDDPANLLVACEMLSFIGIKPLWGGDGALARQRHRRRSGEAW